MPAEDENDSEANRSVSRGSLRKLTEFVGERFHRSEFRRKLILGTGWLILIVIGSISGIWAYSDWAKVTIGDKFTLATLAIAFFAAVLALLAYLVSSGAPDLQLGIMLYKQKKGPYEYELDYLTESKRWETLGRWFTAKTPPNEDLERLSDPDWPSHTVYMWVNNRSRYPAKSPAVILRFGKNNDDPEMGLCWDPPWNKPQAKKPHRFWRGREERNPDRSWRDREESPIWEDTDVATSGIVVLAKQWDGGSTYPIHGRSTRRLPNLAVGNLYSKDLPNKFEVILLAEGYREVVDVTICFKIHD